MTPDEATAIVHRVRAALKSVDLPADVRILVILEFDVGDEILQCMAMPNGGDVLGIMERALKQVIAFEAGEVTSLPVEPS